MDTSLSAFLAVSIVVIVTPGPDTALTIRNTIAGGRAGGLATALGVAVGQLIWAVFTGLGLVAILLASEPVFQALRLAGAAYLVYLGVQSLRSALGRGGGPPNDPVAPAGVRLTAGRAFRQGVINNLANPKMAAFFASVLPQFAAPGAAMLASLLGLGAVFTSLTLLWLALYSWVIATLGGLFRDSRVRRLLDAVAGLTLVGLGVRVGASAR